MGWRIEEKVGGYWKQVGLVSLLNFDILCLYIFVRESPWVFDFQCNGPSFFSLFCHSPCHSESPNRVSIFHLKWEDMGFKFRLCHWIALWPWKSCFSFQTSNSMENLSVKWNKTLSTMWVKSTKYIYRTQLRSCKLGKVCTNLTCLPTNEGQVIHESRILTLP